MSTVKDASGQHNRPSLQCIIYSVYYTLYLDSRAGSVAFGIANFTVLN